MPIAVPGNVAPDLAGSTAIVIGCDVFKGAPKTRLGWSRVPTSDVMHVMATTAAARRPGTKIRFMIEGILSIDVIQRHAHIVLVPNALEERAWSCHEGHATPKRICMQGGQALYVYG